MKPAVFIFALTVLLSSPPVLAAKCKVVAGVFQLWNGWPPSLRLKDVKSGIIYGVNEGAHIPVVMKQAVTHNGQATGTFCVTVVGHTTVPNQKEPIMLVNVVSYSQ